MLTKLLLTQESELEVCGSLMLSTIQLDEVATFLEPVHFFSDTCREIYQTILKLHRDGAPTGADVVFKHVDQTIVEVNDLLTAMEKVNDASFVVEHARAVVRAFRTRSLAKLIVDQTEPLESGIKAIDEAIEGIASGAERIINGNVDTPARSMREIIAELSIRDDRVGITTGIVGLDRKLAGEGWRAGQLVVVGARPSVGKTALMTGLALAASLNGHRSTYLSFEMGDTEIADRIIRQHDLRLSDELDCERACELNVDIRDCAGWTIEKIEAAIRQAARRDGTKLFLIDYLGLISSSNKKRERWQEIGDMTRVLKCLARSLDVTIVAAQQFNRAVEARSSRMPLMSDFRESGNIEQDADILIGIERETRPNQETPVTEAKLHIMKQRNGATGEVLLEYLPERTLFRDRDIPSFEGGF